MKPFSWVLFVSEIWDFSCFQFVKNVIVPITYCGHPGYAELMTCDSPVCWGMCHWKESGAPENIVWRNKVDLPLQYYSVVRVRYSAVMPLTVILTQNAFITSNHLITLSVFGDRISTKFYCLAIINSLCLSQWKLMCSTFYFRYFNFEQSGTWIRWVMHASKVSSEMRCIFGRAILANPNGLWSV